MKNSPIAKFRAPKPALRPPKELKTAGRALWKSLTGEYLINDAGGLTLLLTVCRCEDDIQRFRTALAVDGDLITDRFGQKQPHPLLAAMRGAETVKRQSLRALNLDLEPLKTAHLKGN